MYGGLFISVTRKMILGVEDPMGKGRSKNDFLYDVRTHVKSALGDLELFLSKVEKNQMEKVITKKSKTCQLGSSLS